MEIGSIGVKMATKKNNPEENQFLPEEAVEVQPAAQKKTAGSRKKAASKAKVVEVKAKETPIEAAQPKMIEPRATESSTAEEKITKQEAKNEKTSNLDRGAIVFGGGLLVMGVLLLLGRLLQIPFGVFLWPFIFIVPGLLVFLAALSSDSSSGEGLSILGGILTSLGLVFLMQSITGFWASWAYAWALIAPTSIGISQMIYGDRKERDAIVQSGRRLVNLGLTMFAIGFVFFELILGVSGFGFARYGLPVFPMMLIFFGLVILVRSFMRNR
jgi:hypothetical protein